MASRSASNLTLLVLAAVWVTTSLTFFPTVVGWLSLGFGCAATGGTLTAFAFRGRGYVQRMLDLTIVVLGAWTIVSARTFTGGSLRWQSFAEATALFGLTTLGLIFHEVEVMHVISRQDAALRDTRRAVEPPMALPERRRVGAL
jgi:hypothetical protein